MYRICTRCVMDTTDPEIVFDGEGICNKCTKVVKTMNSFPYNLSPEEKRKMLDRLVTEIKRKGKNKKYDCIIGVSGGADSTYLAFKVKELGLRPLAVHLDNGWDSELAQKNIELTLKKLNIDLYTYVIDWKEFRDIQFSFLKSSTPDLEIPTDHAIIAILFRTAAKYNLKYILTGLNMATESVHATAWSNGIYDWKYVYNIHKLFGKIKFKTYIHFTLAQFIYYRFVLNIKRLSFLDYLDYNRCSAVKILESEIGWRDYAYKHYESFYTKFFQAYILPHKFGFDKRKPHLSSLIMSGQWTRQEALKELKKPLYDRKILKDDIEYVAKKFGIGTDELNKLLKQPNKYFSDYPSYQKDWYYKILLSLNIKYKSLFNHKYFWS